MLARIACSFWGELAADVASRPATTYKKEGADRALNLTFPRMALHIG